MDGMNTLDLCKCIRSLECRRRTEHLLRSEYFEASDHGMPRLCQGHFFYWSEKGLMSHTSQAIRGFESGIHLTHSWREFLFNSLNFNILEGWEGGKGEQFSWGLKNGQIAMLISCWRSELCQENYLVLHLDLAANSSVLLVSFMFRIWDAEKLGHLTGKTVREHLPFLEHSVMTSATFALLGAFCALSALSHRLDALVCNAAVYFPNAHKEVWRLANPRRNCTFGRFGHVVGAIFLFEKLLQGAFLPGLFPGNSWGMRFEFFCGMTLEKKIRSLEKKYVVAVVVVVVVVVLNFFSRAVIFFFQGLVRREASIFFSRGRIFFFQGLPLFCSIQLKPQVFFEFHGSGGGPRWSADGHELSFATNYLGPRLRSRGVFLALWHYFGH